MIRKYTFGAPLPTDAVIQNLLAEKDSLPYFTVRYGEDGSVILSLPLHPEEVLFGLGQAVRGIDKRGHRYESWNSDVFNHTEERPSLYGSHNLLVFFSPDRLLGLYLDDPGKIIWDLGWEKHDEAVITSLSGNLDVYLIEEESLTGIARAFRQLTGRSYLPPRWAFGYIQSRWGYASEEEVRTVVNEHRKRHIPLDGVCLDIDYMVDFKNFTWKPDAFPDLKRFQDEMKADHLRLVPIIDAGIKVEEGYAPYDTGKAGDCFCKKEDGSDFVAAVWPGRCCFPDFLREDVRRWFGDLYRPLLEAGIEGFWNDMNEPALFYSDEGVADAFAAADKIRAGGVDYETTWWLKDVFSGMANSMDDYRRFYHLVDGKPVRHDLVHNLYGAGMTRATAEGFRRFSPDKRLLLFSRSSFIGAHRNGGIWQGDNFSWWSHLKMALQMLPSLNLCGFLFTGCDLGGFGCNVTEDLLERFLQLGVFTPLMRNHSALHTRDQEIYRFSIWETMRDTVSVRYALLPYLYSEFMKAALRDEMLFRPLAFDYSADQRAIHIQDQLMLGEDCMIAPVYEQNAAGRYVYLPEDMLFIRFRSAQDYDLQPLEKGDHWIDLALGEFPLFVKKNRAVPLCPGGESSELLDDTTFTLLGQIEQEGTLSLYRDDGTTTDPDLESSLTRIPLVPDKFLSRIVNA
ncbi:glycoside hydrolase family 31 protein [Aristaeella hokkaidonensis]|uniref:Alpha-glucosidase n=1 Tax=Aristaeella hokkaidonensis TaxID=3046382 RepID=A0AC61MV38_9FIRM|nr:TIM-barrel domain-containing protein [Aristaeella hokkaidonensis]QUC66081.1 alpha-glucosidase [Aristaeella hokkaidonensis]SNT93687.1 alpha-glucosidase [Aristaeella hokkaidonensis]